MVYIVTFIKVGKETERHLVPWMHVLQERICLGSSTGRCNIKRCEVIFKNNLSTIECLLSLFERELTPPVSFPANSIKQRKPKLLLPPAESGSASTMTVLKGETLLLECFAEGL